MGIREKSRENPGDPRGGRRSRGNWELWALRGGIGSCREESGAPGSCWEVVDPAALGKNQELQGNARGSRMDPTAPGRDQELQEGIRSSWEEPGAPVWNSSCLELFDPAAPGKNQELQGGIQEEPGTPGKSQEFQTGGSSSRGVPERNQVVTGGARRFRKEPSGSFREEPGTPGRNQEFQGRTRSSMEEPEVPGQDRPLPGPISRIPLLEQPHPPSQLSLCLTLLQPPQCPPSQKPRGAQEPPPFLRNSRWDTHNPIPKGIPGGI